MKKILSLCASIVVLALSCAAFSGAPANLNQTVTKATPLLFVMLSKSASITPSDEPGIYNLVLNGVNSNVIYFSNVPARVSGQIATKKFIGEWATGSFSKVAPNASIEVVQLDQRTNQLQRSESTYTVVLDRPTFSITNKHELSFKIKPLNNASLPLIHKSDYVAIFIDDSVCFSCIG